MEAGMLQEAGEDDDIDFTKYEDVVLAFTSLMAMLHKNVMESQLQIIKARCMAVTNGMFRDSIKNKADSVDNFFTLLSEHTLYCNWLNIRLVEVIVTASGSKKLEDLVNNYKREIYSRTLKQVCKYIPQDYEKDKFYKEVKMKISKSPDNITVGELIKYNYLFPNKLSSLYVSVATNCINITWLVPIDKVYELFLFALTIPQQSREDDFLKIGSWIVYHPQSVLQELRKKYAMASYFTLLMGYYHGVLLRDIDSDLINDMCSEGLLNTYDQNIISTGHSLHHKKWLLLEHVRHMDTKIFLKFCKLILNSWPEIGEQLISVSDTIKLQPNIQDVTTEIQAALHGHCLKPSLVHIAFLFLIDQVSELLQSCDVKKLVERCGNIMASNQQNIKLFPGDQIEKLNECSDTLSLLWSLNCFLTWSNHSILRVLLTESSSEALQLLDKFDSSLVPKQSAASYPIPYFSSDMIPDDTSTHTILAIRCDQELYEVTLQYVYDMQSLIVDKCGITQHCLQLLAIRSDPTVIYWTIPKCAINIISSQVTENSEHLYSKGVLEVLVYPEPFFTTDTVNDFVMGTLAFTADSRGRNSGEIKTTYPEVDAAINSDNVYFVKHFYDHLNELNLLKKPNADKPVPLSSVLHGQPFTKQCLNEKTFGIHDFLTRFDAEEVEWFLNKPIHNNKGNTCVHEAVLSQCTEKLDIILKHGGSPNVKGLAGKTPVHYACEMISSKTNKCQEILKLLLQHGGDLFEPDNGKITPLDLLQLCAHDDASRSFYRTIVQDFCSFNIDDLKSFKELHRIIQQHGPLQKFQQLYSYTKSNPRYVDSSYHTLLFRACKEGWSDGVYFMLSEMKEVPTTSKTMKETPLHAACERKHYEIVVQLITKFPELLLVQDCLPHRRWHPIHTACAYGASDEILKVLLVGILCLITKGHEMMPSTFVHILSIDVLGRTPLYIATKCGNLSHLHLMMTPFLLEPLMQDAPTLYAIPSTEPWPSSIHCAITYGREELLVSLLNALPLTVFAYPSVFALRHMLQCIQKDTHNKSIKFEQLETTICETSDGELHLIDISSAISNYEVLKNYKVLSNLELSPLAMASAMGNANITKLILDKGAKDDDGLALRLALFLQHHDIAGMMLSCGDSQICLGNMKKLSTFSLPSNILNSFIEIHLEDNSLSSIPLVLFQLPNLKFLNVSNNHLAELPVSNDEFLSGWTCNNIKIISISGNKLKTLPAVIWNISQLKELNADENCISEIESPANFCAKLKTINISHNRLSTVPQHIFLAEEVNISYNRLVRLPEYIWSSRTLTNLNVSQNQIEEVCFPESPCVQIRGMSFVAKGKKTIAHEFKGKISKTPHNTYANSLSSLNLSHNKLTNFPKQLTCFAYHLHKLNISNNPIVILYIRLLPPYLKFISANDCSLENIEIGENLCDHKTHTSLMNLTYLSLKENKLKWFLFSFKSDMDPKNHNLIYPELEYLNLSNNLLHDLDASIQNQKHLNSLILSGNHNLKSLPLELSHLSDTLSLLQLDDIPNLTDSYLKEYQSFQSRLPKLLSYMKSAMKSTVQFRMINLVIVGAAKSGKTSLMRKLIKARQRQLEDEISICNESSDGDKICYRIWDFPSQEKQTAAYFHLYPKQAIYLAIFKLTDDADGINAIKPLEKHLRNIKAHAPGCPVMIIGTHLDTVNVKYDIISQCIHQMYSDTNFFPKIAHIGTYKNEGNVKQLKDNIYSVATRLHYGRRNQLILGDETNEKDPSAILQQYIPQSYLNLQNEIDKKALDLKKKELAPVMNKDEFYKHFHALFEDERDLVSAVQFLHQQSRLFYFEDQSLDKFYFLDLQWIFSTMMNVLKITDSDGIVLNNKIIASSPPTLKIRKDLEDGFLALLVKFNFAIPCKNNYALVHALLPKDLEDSVPALTKSMSTTTADIKANDKHVEGINLYRIWLASFIPDGFWAQLLTRIISDDRISSILSDLLSIPLSQSRYLSSDLSSLWKLCQNGFLIHYDQTKVLELKEVSNEIEDFTNKLNLSKKYATQIELKINTSQIAALCNEYQKISPKQNLASKLLVVIEQHILDIGEEWFPGIFYDIHSKVFSCVPCPVGLSQDDNNGCVVNSDDNTHQYLHFGGCDVFCFSVSDLLDAYATQSRSINCPTHNELLVKKIAPDLCFGDLDDDMLCSPEMPLIIEEENMLGSGGSASVLKGKMGPQQIPVAVKRISGYTTTVEEYRLIRREVNFISTLYHPHLTQLSGVCTHPFMLLIELAPLGSLSAILNKYKHADEVLTPAVLQASVYQVASAINFLHQKHVLHCDLKSSNVLVWEFPLPGQQNSNQRVLLKIADYGVSRMYNVTNQIRYGTIAGTPGFIAPEVYKGKYKDLQSNKIDVFAFGMFMYELLTLLKPFELLPEAPEALLRKQQRPEIPVSAKENLTPCLFQHIMKVCWNQNPSDRPNMAQVVEWSQFPELKFLRTIHQLEPRKLLGVCQCQVVRDHVHQYATVKPENIQSTIPNCDRLKSLFSSLSSQTPRSKRKHSTSNNHTQIWIAQEKDKVTTKLTIVTFRSSDLGYYTHEDTTTAKVVAMTSVGHYMWVYTNDQNLHIIQTATMKTITCVTLTNSSLEVLQLLHVPEWHMVLVLWELSEIWCLYDETYATELCKISSLQLNAQIPVSSFCKVTFGNTTEIWVARKDKGIVILEYSSSGCCEINSNNLVCATDRHEHHGCQLITCLTTDNEKSFTHVWVSFNKSSHLVCWDGPNRSQLHTISLLCEEEGGHCTSLLGHKNHLYVGTSLGKVEVFDSESGHFLKTFSWHSNKVDALIELPPEIKQSICAESKASQSERKVRHKSLQPNFDVDGGPLRKISWQPPSLQSSSYSRSGVYSVPKRPFSQNSPLIVSLGDNLSKKLSMGNQNSEQSVELLTWTGYPTT